MFYEKIYFEGINGLNSGDVQTEKVIALILREITDKKSEVKIKYRRSGWSNPWGCVGVELTYIQPSSSP